VAVTFFAARALGLSLETESALAQALAERGREDRVEPSGPDGERASPRKRQ
jgi:hypothetical protein